MNIAVVSWTRKGSTPLPLEQIEVLNVKKLVVEGDLAVNSPCSMQYCQEIWFGRIQSLHEKKKDAVEASNRLCESPCEEPLSKKRKRTATAKSLQFAEDTVDEESKDEDEDCSITDTTGSHNVKAVSSRKKGQLGKNAKARKPSLPKKKKQETTEKHKAPKSKRKEDALVTHMQAQKLSCAQLVSDIMAPISCTTIDSDVSSESDGGDDDLTALERALTPPLGHASTHPKLPVLTTRPQVGNKTPKSTFPPQKCINVHCKEEKEQLKEKIASLEQQIEELKSSSSRTTGQQKGLVKTPAGQLDATEAAQKGLSEIAEGVWCCPVKVKALINSVSSRTSLACGLLNLFYPRQELTGKRLKDLDPTIVNAIADFAVVAKISLPGPSRENERGDKKAKGTSATRAEVLQALRTKCNALIFQKERPTYHKEKYEEKKKSKEQLKEGTAADQLHN